MTVRQKVRNATLACLAPVAFVFAFVFLLTIVCGHNVGQVLK